MQPQPLWAEAGVTWVINNQSDSLSKTSLLVLIICWPMLAPRTLTVNADDNVRQMEEYVCYQEHSKFTHGQYECTCAARPVPPG